jgi:hypothetical protein
MADADRYRLEVGKKELTNALRQITKFKKIRGKREMMMLSFADGMLRFTMSNVSVGIPAEGKWESDVLAPAFTIYGLARVPLKEDPVQITVEGDHLRIGSSVVRIEWGRSE